MIFGRPLAGVVVDIEELIALGGRPVQSQDTSLDQVDPDLNVNLIVVFSWTLVYQLSAFYHFYQLKELSWFLYFILAEHRTACSSPLLPSDDDIASLTVATSRGNVGDP